MTYLGILAPSAKPGAPPVAHVYEDDLTDDGQRVLLEAYAALRGLTVQTPPTCFRPKTENLPLPKASELLAQWDTPAGKGDGEPA